jgi:hypothetical protein
MADGGQHIVKLLACLRRNINNRHSTCLAVIRKVHFIVQYYKVMYITKYNYKLTLPPCGVLLLIKLTRELTVTHIKYE